MRGIGKGQTIKLFIIPEVQQLLKAQASHGHGCTPEQRAAQLASMPPVARAVAELEDVSAWLLINSMRAEKMCFPLWCLQCSQNVWRKRAFEQLCTRFSEFGSEPTQTSVRGSHRSSSARAARDGQRARADTSEPLGRRQILDVFRERVARDVSNTVPRTFSTRTEIANTAAALDSLIQEAQDVHAIERIQALLIGIEAGESTEPESVDHEPLAEHTSALEQEKEQEHEHEQEQEQEMHVERQQEVELDENPEVEEPEKQKYLRDDDPPRAWALDSLCLSPEFSTASFTGKSEGNTGTAQGFFPAARFEVYRERRSAATSRGPLNWPDYVLLSSDHTSPRWRFESHRRLKNVHVVMEWLPDVEAVEVVRRKDSRHGTTPARTVQCRECTLTSTLLSYHAICKHHLYHGI